MQKIAVGMVMIHCTVCYVSTKQLLKKIQENLIRPQYRWMDCMISLEIPPLPFQSMMSRTQLQSVLRSYLANPL